MDITIDSWHEPSESESAGSLSVHIDFSVSIIHLVSLYMAALSVLERNIKEFFQKFNMFTTSDQWVSWDDWL